MAPIAGKYQLVKNENFAEYLISIGTPEDKARKVDSTKPTVEVTVDGNNITFNIDTGSEKLTHAYIVGQEVDDRITPNVVLKSTAQLNGDTLTITSKTQDGKAGTRVYRFSDSELVLTLNSAVGSVVGKRFYKRV